METNEELEIQEERVVVYDQVDYGKTQVQDEILATQPIDFLLNEPMNKITPKTMNYFEENYQNTHALIQKIILVIKVMI